MDDQQFCRGCSQQDSCRQVYERLGKAQGPSVAWAVVAALLLPLVVFVVCLVAATRILAGLTDAAWVQSLGGLAVGLGGAGVSVFIIRLVSGCVGRGR